MKSVCANCGEAFEFDEHGIMIECCSPSDSFRENDF